MGVEMRQVRPRSAVSGQHPAVQRLGTNRMEPTLPQQIPDCPDRQGGAMGSAELDTTYSHLRKTHSTCSLSVFYVAT